MGIRFYYTILLDTLQERDKIMKILKLISFLINYKNLIYLLCITTHVSAAGLSDWDILEYYHQQWNTQANYSICEKIRGNPNTTLLNLPNHILPMPPLGTVWHREDNLLKLRQHRHYTGFVPDIKIYTFSGITSDNHSRFAYLSLFDDVTVQGYTDCVPESFENHPKVGKLRRYYPSSVKGQGWRGHVLDFSTTICNAFDDPLALDVSTRLSENFVREPYGNWARNIATQRIEKLRTQFGGYSRLFLYPFAKQNINSTKPMPEGVLFCEYGRVPILQHNNTFSIPYSSLHPIHSTTDVSRYLEKTRDKVHNLAGGIGIHPIVLNQIQNDIRIRETLNERSTFDSYMPTEDRYNLANKMGLRLRAESESASIDGKILYLCDLLKSEDDVPREVYKFLAHTISHHASFLDEGCESRNSVVNEKYLHMLQTSMIKQGFSEDDSLIDVLKCIVSNHKDRKSRLDAKTKISDHFFISKRSHDLFTTEFSLPSPTTPLELPQVKEEIKTEGVSECETSKIKCENKPLKFKREENDSPFLNKTITEIKENLSYIQNGLLEIEIRNLYTVDTNYLIELFEAILKEKNQLSIYFSWTPKIKPVIERSVATPKTIKKRFDKLQNEFQDRFIAQRIDEQKLIQPASPSSPPRRSSPHILTYNSPVSVTNMMVTPPRTKQMHSEDRVVTAQSLNTCTPPSPRMPYPHTFAYNSPVSVTNMIVTPPHHHSSFSHSNSHPGQTWVKPYTRSNGTQVSGYWRSSTNAKHKR